jgi:hypothetical protein
MVPIYGVNGDRTEWILSTTYELVIPFIQPILWQVKLRKMRERGLYFCPFFLFFIFSFFHEVMDGMLMLFLCLFFFIN